MNDIRSRILTGFSLETTAKGAASFHQAASYIPENTQVKIAFLGNETIEQRLFAIKMLRAHQLRPMPIISARRLPSSAALDSYLMQAKKVGQIESIFLVGGDPVGPQGPFADSMDVINSNLIDKFDIDMVGVAGYPMGHPRICDEVLWAYLKLKIHGLESRGFSVEITTQLSFNVEGILFWIEQVRHAGIQVPIRIGIPSPSTLGGLLKFASQCRVSTSIGLLRQYGWQVTSLLSTVGPDNFLATIQEGLEQRDLGDVRLHVYPMGDLSNAMQWAQGGFSTSS